MNRFINKDHIKHWFSKFILGQRNPQIYLLQEREMIRLNEDTYKIGRTDVPLTRFNQYPKHSLLLKMNPVNNSLEVERIAKICFAENFKQMRKYGVEYFYGNRFEMMSMIDKITCQHQLSNVVSMWRITVLNKAKPLPQLPLKKLNFNFNKVLPSLPVKRAKMNETKSFLSSIVVKLGATCDKCKKQFSSTRSLKKHLREKIIPCDFVCKKCNKCFSNRLAYIEHQDDLNHKLKINIKYR